MSPKTSVAKLVEDTKKDWEQFIAGLGSAATGRAAAYLESRPQLGGYGPYELGQVAILGGTTDHAYSCSFTVKFVYDYKDKTLGIGVASGPHTLGSLSSRGTFKDAPARLKKALDYLKSDIQKKALEVKPPGPKGVEDVTRKLRHIALGKFGPLRGAPEYQKEADLHMWSLEPSGRQRLDHYGFDENGDEGWDDDGWNSDYSGPLYRIVSKWLNEHFPDLKFGIDITDKGFIFLQLSNEQLQTVKEANAHKWASDLPKMSVRDMSQADGTTKVVISGELSDLLVDDLKGEILSLAKRVSTQAKKAKDGDEYPVILEIDMTGVTTIGKLGVGLIVGLVRSLYPYMPHLAQVTIEAKRQSNAGVWNALALIGRLNTLEAKELGISLIST